MEHPKPYFVVYDYLNVYEKDGDACNCSLTEFYELVAEAKTQFLGKIAEVCLENNVPLVELRDEDIELKGMWRLSFRSHEIPNPNYEKQLAEYNAWMKAEEEKELREKQEKKAQRDARASFKAQSREVRINNRVSSIVSSEKSADEKLKEIAKLLGEKND
jgi:hypothetical protein